MRLSGPDETLTRSATLPAKAEPDVASGISGSPATWLLGLLQAGDSFYPTGSYAHSFGLEGLAQAGVIHDRSSLREFVFGSTLRSLEHAELPIVAHAWHAMAKGDWVRIGELSVLCSALKSAREARLASENIGRQRAELMATLHPTSLAPEYLRRVAAKGWPFAAPVSAALEARVLGAPIEAALAGYSYSAIAGLLAAAMKLLRLGQNGAQSLLAEALAATPAIIARAQTVSFDEIGWFNPWLDIAAARHEAADARMFIS